MAISLKKGERVSLTKDNPGLDKIMIGLGWDANKGGILKGLFGGGDFDLDSSVFVLRHGKLVSPSRDTVYFHNLTHESGAIKHHGDNLTGGGDGDDEQITVQLSKLPSDVDRLVFAVNIYSAKTRNQHFGMVKNAFIRIVNEDTNEEMLRYNLTDDYSGKTAMIFAEIYKKDNEWKFKAIGEGTSHGSIAEMSEKFR